MKWYKHISDSLDDPFIFDLMTLFGSDGYLVFFGTLEIYAREFSPKVGWKLRITRAYLKQKLGKRQDTLIIKSLKHIQNSGKWEIEITDNELIIFIPKFTELLDEWTQRKLGSYSGVTPKILGTDKDKELDKDKPPIVPHKKGGTVYNEDFLKFWQVYPKKVGKDAAWKAWNSRNGTRESIEAILKAVNIQKGCEQWKKDKGQFIPNPSTWINRGQWADEVTTPKATGWA